MFVFSNHEEQQCAVCIWKSTGSRTH